MIIRSFITGGLEFLVLMSREDARASASVVGIPIVLKFADGGAVHGVEDADNGGIRVLNAESRVSKLLGNVQAKRGGANGSSVAGDPLGVQMLHDAGHALLGFECELELGVVASLDQQESDVLSARHELDSQFLRSRVAFGSHGIELLALAKDAILDGFSEFNGGLFKLGLAFGLPVGEEGNQGIDAVAVIEVEVHSLEQSRDLAENSVVVSANLFGSLSTNIGCNRTPVTGIAHKGVEENAFFALTPGFPRTAF